MSKELKKITTKNLEASGITTSLNQNDIIDIIVDKKRKDLLDKIDAFDKVFSDIRNKISSVQETIKERIITEVSSVLKVPKKDISFAWTGYYDQKQLKNVSCNRIREDSNSRKDDQYMLVEWNLTMPLEENFSVRVLTESTIKSKLGPITKKEHFDFRSSTPVFDIKTVNTIIKEIEKYNKEVEVFWNSLPKDKKGKVDLNINSISRHIKNRINSSILKNQASEITTQIESMFGIKI